MLRPSLRPCRRLNQRGRRAAGAGDTLRILFWQAPKILNPHLTLGAADWAAARVTYEPLASYAADGTLVPFLAAEIPSLENGGVAPDGKSVTWKLKQGIRWSDGEPFTAEDVRFTYDFIKNPDTGATTSATYSAVEDVEVIDDHTVKVNFEQVTPAWSLPFVGVQGLILPKHVFEPYNGPRAAESRTNPLPVGTGPYRVVRFKPEEVLFLGNNLIETNKIVYEPNPHFRELDKPYFSRVELKGGGTVDEAARSVLQVGDVDFANNLQIDAETQQRLEAGGKGTILAPFGAFVERILLNRTDPDRATADGERSSIQFPNPFFSDPQVRQAFALAVDRDAIAKLYGRTGTPTSNVLVSPDKFQSTNNSYEFNLDKAARLLDEAGWMRRRRGWHPHQGWRQVERTVPDFSEPRAAADPGHREECLGVDRRGGPINLFRLQRVLRHRPEQHQQPAPLLRRHGDVRHRQPQP